MKATTRLKIIFFLSLMGIIISVYLTGIYYQEKSSFCDINDTLSCSAVSNSLYAQVFTIPVSLYGLLGYGFFALVCLFLLEKPPWLKKKKIMQQLFSGESMFSLALISFIFSLYLTYHEIFTIKVLCILCLLSQALIIVIFFLAYQLIREQKKINNP